MQNNYKPWRYEISMMNTFTSIQKGLENAWEFAKIMKDQNFKIIVVLDLPGVGRRSVGHSISLNYLNKLSEKEYKKVAEQIIELMNILANNYGVAEIITIKGCELRSSRVYKNMEITENKEEEVLEVIEGLEDVEGVETNNRQNEVWENENKNIEELERIGRLLNIIIIMSVIGLILTYKYTYI